MRLLKRCVNCLNAETRPRISFDQRGFCNACIWAERKSSFDWTPRQKELESIIDLMKTSTRRDEYHCIVPVSGGKDGSYIAHTLKSKYGLRVLAVTVTPALQTPLGAVNVTNFINSGFDTLQININPISLRYFNKRGFQELGFPYFAWQVAITTAVVRAAAAHGIKTIFYADDGEVEYGGIQETAASSSFTADYVQKIYWESGYEKVFVSTEVDSKYFKYFFCLPAKHELEQIKLYHWSYFENWDPYRNYMVAKNHCGLRESESPNQGTFTNFAQLDQSLYPLHTYLMYLKFGFGRATQDAGIEIRRGALDREQALNLVNLYDGHLPAENIPLYLDYYQMDESEFYSVLDKFANPLLFSRRGNTWVKKFTSE